MGNDLLGVKSLLSTRRSAGGPPGSGAKSRARVVRNFVPKRAPQDRTWTDPGSVTGSALARRSYGIGTALVLQSCSIGTTQTQHCYCTNTALLLMWHGACTIDWRPNGTAMVRAALVLQECSTSTAQVLDTYSTTTMLSRCRVILAQHKRNTGTEHVLHCYSCGMLLVRLIDWHPNGTAMVRHWHCTGTALVLCWCCSSAILVPHNHWTNIPLPLHSRCRDTGIALVLHWHHTRSPALLQR